MFIFKHMLHCPGTEKAAVVTKMSLTLSADHRIFDGQVGGIDHLSPVISPVFSPGIYTLPFMPHCGTGKFFTELALNFSDIRRLLL